MFASLRHRLAAASFALVVGACIICQAGLHLAFEVAEDRLYDTRMQSQVDDLLALYDRDPGIINVPMHNFRIYAAPVGDTRGLPADLRNLPIDVDEVMRDGHEFDVQIATRGSTLLYFLSDESDFNAFEHSLFGAMAGLMLSVVIVAGIASLALARRATAPLTTLAEQVTALDDRGGDGIVLTAAALRDDALATLARAIDGYHRRLSALLNREREFSADVSHELRTPLMAIQGAAELLARKPLDERAHGELVQRVRRGCQNMTTLTEALLFLARDTQSFHELVEPVSVAQVVAQQVAALREIATNKGVAFAIDDDGDASTVEAIPAVINIVIGNILKNAVKYTNRERVSVFLRPRQVVIQDYGPGIDEDLRLRMFERHVRGTESEARAASDSNGIGLALVRRFCEAYGWRIELDSTLGSGTRVALQF